LYKKIYVSNHEQSKIYKNLSKTQPYTYIYLFQNQHIFSSRQIRVSALYSQQQAGHERK